MAETSMQDLLAQRAELNKQIAQHEIGPIQSALDKLNKASTKTLVTDLQAIVDQLPQSEVRTQINNVVIVLGNVPGILERALGDLQALITPAEPPAE